VPRVRRDNPAHAYLKHTYPTATKTWTEIQPNSIMPTASQQWTRIRTVSRVGLGGVTLLAVTPGWLAGSLLTAARCLVVRCQSLARCSLLHLHTLLFSSSNKNGFDHPDLKKGSLSPTVSSRPSSASSCAFNNGGSKLEDTTKLVEKTCPGGDTRNDKARKRVLEG
jgi:hypothetical protein